MVGTNDLEKSSKFYDAILAHLGMKRVTITERYIGYGHSSEDSGVKFYITKPITLLITLEVLLLLSLDMQLYHL